MEEIDLSVPHYCPRCNRKLVLSYFGTNAKLFRLDCPIERHLHNFGYTGQVGPEAAVLHQAQFRFADWSYPFIHINYDPDETFIALAYAKNIKFGLVPISAFDFSSRLKLIDYCERLCLLS